MHYLRKALKALNCAHLSLFLALFVAISPNTAGASEPIAGNTISIQQGRKLERFTAAVESANRSIKSGNPLWAQIQLRRAFEYAPTDGARGEVAALYRAVSSRNPIKLSFSFSISPTDNANDGSEVDFVVIGGLPFYLNPSDLEIPGHRLDLAFDAAYRISESSKQRTEIFGEADHRRVYFARSENDLGEGVSASDFTTNALSLGARTYRLLFPNLGVTELAALGGRSWKGGAEYQDTAELRLAQTINMSPRSAFRLYMSARHNERHDFNTNSSNGLLFSTSWSSILNNSSSVTLDLFANDVTSESSLIDSRAIGFGLRWIAPETGKFRTTTQAAIEQRIFPKFNSIEGGRTDNTFSANVELSRTDLNYLGFHPSVNFGIRSVSSSIGIFTRQDLFMGLFIRSNF